MKSEEIKKHLSRKFTVMLIPHSQLRPIQLNVSVALLGMLVLSWTGLTLWSGFIASRHVDYWRTKADEHVMRAKVWYFAQQMRKSREYIDHVRETELTLENLLQMKTRKAIVQSNNAVGGPTHGDEKQLAALMSGHLDTMSIDDMKEQFDNVQRSGDHVVSDFQAISDYIKDQHTLFRATPLSWPTPGRLTSVFGLRAAPLEEEGEREFHRGIDIANHQGTPVQATADGVVALASWQGGYGRLVVLDHGRGYRTFYAHNEKLLVSVGDHVTRGQVISYMGTSGHSTGYHLHYEVWKNGQAVNPMHFVKADESK